MKKLNLPIIFLCLVLIIAIILLLFLSKKIVRDNSQAKIQELSDALAKKNDEIHSLLNQISQLSKEKALMDSQGATLTSTEEKIYQKGDFKSFHSPYFEGRKVNVSVYQYRKHKIKRYWISSENDSGQKLGVELWRLDYMDRQDPLPGFPILGGYENYANNIRWTFPLMHSWSKENQYINSENIPMYWFIEWMPPKASWITDVSLSFYDEISKSFFSIRYPVEKGPTDENNLAVVKAKEELRKIADTVTNDLP